MLDFSRHNIISTPEQRLFAAILSQAFTDMFLVPGTTSREVDCGQAMNFLTERYGRSVKWRNTLCSAVGLDGDVLCDRVRMILNGDADPPNLQALTTHVKFARARWRKMAS